MHLKHDQVLTGAVSKSVTVAIQANRTHQRIVFKGCVRCISAVQISDRQDRSQPKRLTSLQDLPNEVLLQIFCELPGDAYTMRSLLLTCRAWRALLSMNHQHIGDSIAESKKGILSILLKCTSRLRGIHSPLRWLGAAYRRAEKIELLLDCFDGIGAFEDERSWRPDTALFSPAFGQRVQEPQQLLFRKSDARRYIQTVFLATELCSLRADYIRKRTYLRRTSPAYVTEFTHQILECSVYLIYHLAVSIDNYDTPTNGTGLKCLLTLPVMSLRYKPVTIRLAGTFLEYGPSAVVDLLCRKWKSLEVFSEALATNFPGVQHRLDVEQPSWNGFLIVDGEFAIASRQREMLAAGQTKFLIGHNMDISAFMEAVPNEEEWEQLMVQLGWSNPVPLNELIG